MTPRHRGFVLGLALAAVPIAAGAEDTFEGVDRIVAVGDVHGDYAQLLTVLQDAALVDAKGRWIGGRAHLVQTGDRIDRGPDSRKVMDLFMRLEKDARKAGGAVHALIGNHEAMNVLGDLRYTTAEEFAAFKRPDSGPLRDALFAHIAEARQARKEPPLTPEERRQWEAAHPLGFAEHRIAFAPDGVYGSWIARLNAIIRIGDTLFVHGGLSPKYGDFSLAAINDRIRQELRSGDHRLAVMSNDPDGPLWFRGLADGDPALEAHLQAVLQRLGCRRLVVGHTPTVGLVMPRYGGRVLEIDVGLSKAFGGPPAALVIEKGRPFALHRKRLVPIPEEPGEPLLRYVREIAALEPRPSPIADLAESLAAPAPLKADPAPQP